MRLAARHEGFERYQDPGKPTEFTAGCGGFAPEAERFDKDFACAPVPRIPRPHTHTARPPLLSFAQSSAWTHPIALVRSVVEKVQRQNDREKHGAIIDARRQERLDREEERWQITEQARQLENERGIALQQTDKAKANLSSLPYDPITLMYNDGNDGQRLKYYDDKVKYRAGLRAQNMQKHDMSTPCATARLLRSVFFVCIASWGSRGKQQMCVGDAKRLIAPRVPQVQPYHRPTRV